MSLEAQGVTKPVHAMAVRSAAQAHLLREVAAKAVDLVRDRLVRLHDKETYDTTHGVSNTHARLRTALTPCS
jgi:hypothetical protein